MARRQVARVRACMHLQVNIFTKKKGSRVGDSLAVDDKININGVAAPETMGVKGPARSLGKMFLFFVHAAVSLHISWANRLDAHLLLPLLFPLLHPRFCSRLTRKLAISSELHVFPLGVETAVCVVNDCGLLFLGCRREELSWPVLWILVMAH